MRDADFGTAHESSLLLPGCSQSQELQLAGEGRTASYTKALASQQGHSAFQKCFQNLLGGGAVGGCCLSNHILFCDLGL